MKEPMDSGHDMEALIAIRWMGFDANCFVDDEGQLRDAECEAVPSYSTNMAAAWQVVKKLRSDGWFFRLDDDAGGYGPWRAEFTRMSEDDALGCAMTAPLAICRAALAASESPA